MEPNETQLIICVLFIGAIAHLVAYQVWATRGDRGIENYDTRVRPFMWTVWAWPFHYGVFACLLIDYLWGNKAKERKYYEYLGRYYASGLGGGYSAAGLAAPQIGEEANEAIQEARRITITTRPVGHSPTAGTGATHSSTTDSEVDR